MVKKRVKKQFLGNASIIKRLLALIIDLLIIDLFILFPFKRVFTRITNSMSGDFMQLYDYFMNNPGVADALGYVLLAASVVILLYFTLLQWKLHQTIGMMLMRIYVVNADSEKKDPGIGFWKALVRNLVFVPFFPFYLLWFTVPFFIIFTKTNQRLLELLTKTRTVQVYDLKTNIY